MKHRAGGDETRIAPRIAFATCLLAFCTVFAVSVANARQQAADDASNPLTSDKQSYVGSAVCGQCHQEVYAKYSRTSMGCSIVPVTPALAESLHTPASVVIKDLHQYIDVFIREGKLYQSQYEIDSAGKEVFRDTHEVDWIVGSGINGFGGLVRNGNYLFQTPLSFYSKPQTWDLSPGYEFGNYGFNRPILAGCIVCHSGRAVPILEGNAKFKDPPFIEPAIGCENCHGPGAVHVRTASRGGVNFAKRTIVNPARLSPALANDICIFCHQTGDVRVLQPGRDYQDFRPGEPLDKTLSIFLVPPKSRAPLQSEHLEHYYSMTLSKCYRASEGKLRCITCHDPHEEPSEKEAPAYFARKCAICHRDASWRKQDNVRQHSSRGDCIACHMPKRDIGVILHSSVTSHRITAQPDEPLPEEAFHQTTAALPELIHLSALRSQKAEPPPQLTLLQAYGELMDKHPEYFGQYTATLSELEKSQPNNSLVQASWGRKTLREGKISEAALHLRKAVDLGPPRASTYADLAEAQQKLGELDNAIVSLERAADIDPYNPVFQKALILRLIEEKRYAQARTRLEGYVRTFPQDSFMRQLLERARSGDSQK